MRMWSWFLLACSVRAVFLVLKCIYLLWFFRKLCSFLFVRARRLERAGCGQPYYLASVLCGRGTPAPTPSANEQVRCKWIDGLPPPPTPYTLTVPTLRPTVNEDMDVDKGKFEVGGVTNTPHKTETAESKLRVHPPHRWRLEQQKIEIKEVTAGS